jgi:hypothetical protein
VVAVLGVGSLALFATRDSADDTIEIGPDSTVSTVRSTAHSNPEDPPQTTSDNLQPDWSWLTPFGQEISAPVVPSGWTLQDVSDLRFAVPGDWTAPISSSCAPATSGVVLVPAALSSTSSCDPATPLPAATVTVRLATGNQSGEPVTVGTLSATKVVDDSCDDCPPAYRFENGLEMIVTGHQSEQILATLTDSGSRRALQAGPVADTTGWQQVTYAGIKLFAPKSWPVVDLVGSYITSTDADGNTSVSGGLDPGQCGRGMFASSATRRVFIGTSPIVPSCLAPIEYDLEPHDGVWIRPADGTSIDPTDRIVAEGVTGGLDVKIIAPASTADSQPSPRLELLVEHGDTSVRISLGVGTDAATARTIMRSLTTDLSADSATNTSIAPPAEQLPATGWRLLGHTSGALGDLIPRWAVSPNDLASLADDLQLPEPAESVNFDREFVVAFSTYGTSCEPTISVETDGGTSWWASFTVDESSGCRSIRTVHTYLVALNRSVIPDTVRLYTSVPGEREMAAPVTINLTDGALLNGGLDINSGPFIGCGPTGSYDIQMTIDSLVSRDIDIQIESEGAPIGGTTARIETGQTNLTVPFDPAWADYESVGVVMIAMNDPTAELHGGFDDPSALAEQLPDECT